VNLEPIEIRANYKPVTKRAVRLANDALRKANAAEKAELDERARFYQDGVIPTDWDDEGGCKRWLARHELTKELISKAQTIQWFAAKLCQEDEGAGPAST